MLHVYIWRGAAGDLGWPCLRRRTSVSAGRCAGQYRQLAPLYEKFLFTSTYWAAKCATAGQVDDAQRLLEVAHEEERCWPLPTPPFATFWDLRGLGLVVAATVCARKGKLRQAAKLLRQAMALEPAARRRLASSTLARINLAAAEILLNKPINAHQHLAAAAALAPLAVAGKQDEAEEVEQAVDGLLAAASLGSLPAPSLGNPPRHIQVRS
jgi:hypothetical protein